MSGDCDLCGSHDHVETNCPHFYLDSTRKLRGQVGSYELWLESYGEVLGCDAKPTSIAVAIQALQAERDRAVASIPEHRKAARDAVIQGMRNTAVNCGNHGACSVSHWFKLSSEEE